MAQIEMVTLYNGLRTWTVNANGKVRSIWSTREAAIKAAAQVDALELAIRKHCSA